jgi:hypothetical protein
MMEKINIEQQVKQRDMKKLLLGFILLLSLFSVLFEFLLQHCFQDYNLLKVLLLMLLVKQI